MKDPRKAIVVHLKMNEDELVELKEDITNLFRIASGDRIKTNREEITPVFMQLESLTIDSCKNIQLFLLVLRNKLELRELPRIGQTVRIIASEKISIEHYSVFLRRQEAVVRILTDFDFND